jgi:hypothetical protein
MVIECVYFIIIYCAVKVKIILQTFKSIDVVYQKLKFHVSTIDDKNLKTHVSSIDTVHKNQQSHVSNIVIVYQN